MIAPQRKHPSSRPAPAPHPGPPPRFTVIPALQRLLHLHTSPLHPNHHHHTTARPCLRGTPPRHATAVTPRRPRPTHASPACLRRSPLPHAPDTRPCCTGPPYPTHTPYATAARHGRSPPPQVVAARPCHTPPAHELVTPPMTCWLLGKRMAPSPTPPPPTPPPHATLDPQHATAALLRRSPAPAASVHRSPRRTPPHTPRPLAPTERPRSTLAPALPSHCHRKPPPHALAAGPRCTPLSHVSLSPPPQHAPAALLTLPSHDPTESPSRSPPPLPPPAQTHCTPCRTLASATHPPAARLRRTPTSGWLDRRMTCRA